MHRVDEKTLREDTLGYHAFDWYHNPYTMDAFAQFAPGQFSTFYSSIVHPAGNGRFHFAGEVASPHHAWVAGALDSVKRVVKEIIFLDFPKEVSKFNEEYKGSFVFTDQKRFEEQIFRGLFSKQLEKASRRLYL
jgi:hypothetical protein